MREIHYNVYCACLRELIPVNTVKFLNIEEGPQGEDRMTFACPHCGENHTGTVYG